MTPCTVSATSFCQRALMRVHIESTCLNVFQMAPALFKGLTFKLSLKKNCTARLFSQKSILYLSAQDSRAELNEQNHMSCQLHIFTSGFPQNPLLRTCACGHLSRNRFVIRGVQEGSKGQLKHFSSRPDSRARARISP